MRISDWSSDVCSADLAARLCGGLCRGASDLLQLWRLRPDDLRRPHSVGDVPHLPRVGAPLRKARRMTDDYDPAEDGRRSYELAIAEIGRASCRERVCQYV